jgi:signal peptidase I
MEFDFPTILVWATLVTGILWGIDIFILEKRRDRLGEKLRSEAVESRVIEQVMKPAAIFEMGRSLFPVILAVLVLRSFVVEPFRIPSGSMMPTLLHGDFILVNKFAYGIRLPSVDTKIFDIGTPKRGDIIVFRYPKDPDTDYIKRVIGVPGDVIVEEDKKLYINGIEAPQELLGFYEGEGANSSMNGTPLYAENLNGVKHEVLIRPNGLTDRREYTVGEDEYFVMGDNRDNSYDSRAWGTVPDANLRGKAFIIWLNVDPQTYDFNWARIGTSLH